MSQVLTAYIQNQLDERRLSGRAAAEAMDISHSYFVRVATGKVERPGVEFCTKLAELFSDSPIKVMRLAGWFPGEDLDESLVEEIQHLARTDPGFKELVEIYQGLDSDESKKLFLAMVRAGLEVVDKNKSPD